MPDKEFLGFLSVAVAAASYAPYIRAILEKQIKPHAFSWFVWTTTEIITFAAQWSKGAGAGAWVTGFSIVSSFGIGLMALRWGEKNITRGDWISFLGALAAVPLWYMTRDPLGSVVLVSMIDSSAYYPTFRKSWKKPHEEKVWTFLLGSGKYAMGLAAMEHYSIVTALFPSCIVFMDVVFISMLVWRRRVLARA